MVMISKAYFIILFFLGVYMISHNASSREHKLDVDAPLFDYREPAKWRTLDPRYELCSTGTQQSPIDLNKKTVKSDKGMKSLAVLYDVTNATLVTDGIVPQLIVKGKSEIAMVSRSYKLLGLRWHTPSEHTINGQRYVAELQQVFAWENDIVIIATVYLVGPPDPIVAAIEPLMAKLAKGISPVDEDRVLKDEVPAGKITADLLKKIPTENFIMYSGSLTTPPCTEGVTWFLTDPQTMTLEQVKLINGLQSKSNKVNSRPIQPLNGRPVSANEK